MKKIIFTTAILVVLAFAEAQAQEPQLQAFGLEQLYQPGPQEQQEYNPYPFYVRPRFQINWLPGNTDIQRYTVAVNPVYLIYSGLKVDFEYELRKPGRWIETSLIGYYAPHRDRENYWWGDYYGNNRASMRSSYDSFDKMWGIGTSIMYKHMWHRRGWYFSTGLVVEYYRVGDIRSGYLPYEEDGLTFYTAGDYSHKMSFVKPTAQFNFGKHMALSRRCFFDMYIGIGYSYSFYNKEHFEYFYNDYYTGKEQVYYYPDYSGMYGFARRGFVLTGGFRIGVLFWDKHKRSKS